MTSRELFSVLLRRWYLMVIGAALSLGVLYTALHQQPTYYTQYFVVILPPRSATFPNSIEDPHFGLTPMAGLVVSDYNAGRRAPLMGSAETTLYGQSLRFGSQVRLPNDGSQWQPLYVKPNIDVQVVGSDPDRVRSKAQQIARELTALLKARQDQMGVQDSVRMTALTSPQDPVIAQVGGSRSRAALTITLLGATFTTLVVVQVDRWRGRRARRRTGSRPGSPTAEVREPVLVE